MILLPFPTQHAHLREKALAIKLVLTDCDGVLTDTGVYFGPEGEALKRFSIRDGMGVERLRKLAGLETGIVTGEDTQTVIQRARKLQIEELHLAAKDKPAVLEGILKKRGIQAEEVAYIGDDSNDVNVMKLCGLTAAPADALPFAQEAAHYVCSAPGGYGAFRQFAELILSLRLASPPNGK